MTAKQPTALRELRGAKLPLIRVENEAMPDVPDSFPPAPVTLTEAEALVWWEQGPMLWQLGLLTEADLDEFEHFCAVRMRWETARVNVRLQGLTIHNSAGSLIKNPNVAIMETAGTELMKLRQNFGMNPVARTRIEAKPRDADKQHSRFGSTVRR